jgi:hypothetical protein
MAQIIKKNESVTAPFFKNGVTLQYFTITFPSDVSSLLSATALGVRSPVVVALEAIQARTSVEIIGTVQTTTLNIAVAALGGAYGSDNYDGNHPNKDQTFASYLQALVQAEGSYQGVNLATATVSATTF